jgi:hypothetical protein
MCVILLGMDYFSPDTREGRKAAFIAARDAAGGKSRDEVSALYLAELRARDISPPLGDYLEMNVTRIIKAAAWKEGPAFRAARDAATGKSHDEVRALYLAELRARDISPPPANQLKRDVTRIIDASAHLAGRGAATDRRAPSAPGPLDSLRFAARAIRNAGQVREQLLPQYRPGRRTKYIHPDRSAEPIRVVLEPGAGQWLAAGRHLPRTADPATRVDVWLDFTVATAGDRLVRVHISDFLVGVLRPEDGDEFRAEIEDAQRGGYVLMTSGFIAGGDESTTAFYVYRFAAD